VVPQGYSLTINSVNTWFEYQMENTIVSLNYLNLLFQYFIFYHFSTTMDSDTTEIIEYS